jgi:hypothetical protein
MRHIDVYHVRNLAWFAANFKFANYLFQKTLSLTNPGWLAQQVQRHCHFDLLPRNESVKVRMDQTPTHGIYLAIAKHYFARAHTFNVNGKDRVSSCLRPKNCGQLSEGCERSQGRAFPTVDSDRDHPGLACASSIVLATTFSGLGSNRNFFVFCHDYSSLQTSATSAEIFLIFNCQIPIFGNDLINPVANWKLLEAQVVQSWSAIQNQKSAG